MIVRVNGRVWSQPEILAVLEITEPTTLDKIAAHVKRNYRAYLVAGYTILMVIQPSTALAAGNVNGGIRLILLMQKASFWVGMGVTIWGIVEAQLDYPGWKGRVLKGVLGYIGILLVPLVFLELQNSLQVDVWNQLQGATTPGITPQPPTVTQ